MKDLNVSACKAGGHIGMKVFVGWWLDRQF